MLKILQYGNKILEQKSNPVADIASKETQKLIDDMLEVLEHEADHSAGISAPQVGQLVRIAICRRMDLESEKKSKKKESPKPIWEIMINPKVLSKSKEESVFWEGCLSINHGDLFGQVSRPSNITVEYLDREGKEHVIEATGYFSHVVQHELDHLDGILFIKYIPDPSKLYTSEEME